MENFDSLVAKYIKENNGNSDINSIKEQMINIKKNIREKAFERDKNASLFEVQGDVTQEDLTTFINSLSNGVSLDNEAATLFAILDKDGDNKLDKDEIQILKRRSGKIDGFGIWSKINVHEDKINDINKKAEKEEEESNNVAEDDDDITEYDISNDDDDDDDDETNDLQNLKTGRTEGDNTNDITSKQIIEIAKKIASGKDNLQKYKSILSEDDYKLLEAAVEKIKKEETIETNADNKPTDKKIKQINKYVEDLHTAMSGVTIDNSELESMINDDKITDTDLAKILKEYKQKYGNEKSSLVKELKNSFSAMGTKDDLMRTIGERLVNAAKQGSDDAIEMICKELYLSVQGAGTNEVFIDAIFNNANDEVLGKVSARYGKYNNGSNLIDDINSDYLYGADEMIKKLKEAARHYIE